MYGWSQGVLNWAPMMPTDASLSNSYKSDRWRFSCPAVFLHWENYVSISFNIEWDMIVVTVYLSILNQMELRLVQNRKENCHHDHIPFNVKGNGNIVFSVQDDIAHTFCAGSLVYLGSVSAHMFASYLLSLLYYILLSLRVIGFSFPVSNWMENYQYNLQNRQKLI